MQPKVPTDGADDDDLARMVEELSARTCASSRRSRRGRANLTEALEQQTATSELLKVIGRSTFNVQPVFEALADNAVKLCAAERSGIFRFDGQTLRLMAIHNQAPEMRAFINARNIITLGRDTAVGRAALERRTIHIPTMLEADPEYTYPARKVDPIPMRTVLASRCCRKTRHSASSSS